MLDSKTSVSIKTLVLCGVMAALIIALTYLVQVPIFSGYVHPGDAGIYVSAYIMGPLPAAMVGAVASMIVDVISGYAIYAIPTFIVKGLMALLSAVLFKKLRSSSGKVIAMVLGGAVMALGYFVAEIVLFGYAIAAMDLPMNLIQLIAGVALAFPVILLFKGQSYYK